MSATETGILEYVWWLVQTLFVQYQLITWPLVSIVTVAGLTGAATKSRAGAALAGAVAGTIVFLGLLILPTLKGGT